jgi:formate/nitrite transporter FocA (FNT family)
MTHAQKTALAVLAGISLGTGVLLYLAVAVDSLPGGPVLIALGSVVISLALLGSVLWNASGSDRCPVESDEASWGR